MKLVNNSGKLSINLNELTVDKSLPKYKKVIDYDKKFSVKNSESVINEIEMFDYETEEIIVTPDEISQQFSEIRTDIIQSVDFRKHLTDKNGEKFNIKISKYLLNIPDSNRSFFNPDFVISDVKNDSSENTEQSWWKKLILPSKRNLVKKENDLISIFDLFSQVKVVAGTKHIFTDRIDSYLKLISNARLMGQIAQEEELISKIIIHIYESILATAGKSRYIDANVLEKLQKKCNKQLNIDYIKNFNRLVPDEVIQKKVELDKLMIFDNYLVLHYDPTGESTKLTQKEIQEKKDPILFGVIRGSTKLYYVGDWIDEYCDLTWDVIVEKVGKKIKPL